eukprot:c19645_g1_i1 orf=131-892(+)
MDAASAFFQSFSSPPRYASLKRFTPLSPRVQHHLLKVYSTLAAAVVLSCFGIYLHILLRIGGILTTIGFVVSTLWLISTSSSPTEEGKRLKLLAVAAACQGASLGPLVELVLEFDSRILVTAFIGTAAIFVCFSAAAFFARRREFLFLGGILGSIVTAFCWLQFASMLFGGSSLYFMVEIYGGLLLFVGYVLFDTQMIIEKADRGDLDYVKHCLDLFIDFAAIFVRVLVILTKNAGERTEKDSRERRNNTRRR